MEAPLGIGLLFWKESDMEIMKGLWQKVHWGAEKVTKVALALEESLVEKLLKAPPSSQLPTFY